MPRMKATRTTRYWCKNGCGKSVYNLVSGKVGGLKTPRFRCRRCGKEYFKLQELKN